MRPDVSHRQEEHADIPNRHRPPGWPIPALCIEADTSGSKSHAAPKAPDANLARAIALCEKREFGEHAGSYLAGERSPQLCAPAEAGRVPLGSGARSSYPRSMWLRRESETLDREPEPERNSRAGVGLPKVSSHVR